MTVGGSSIAHKVAVQRNLRVPMRDGITLSADLYRPAGPDGRPIEGAFPTILERTPYDRTRQFQHRCGQYFASRGYNWCAIDCRGRGDSDGVFHFYNAHHEGLDGHDSVEWIAGQPWSDGRIGTTGLSFAGSNQQATAVMRPPHLTTQFIIDCGVNYWRRTLRNNGAFAEGIFAPYVFRMAISGREAAADPSIRRALEQYLADIHNWIRKLPLRPGATPLALVPSYERWYFEIATTGDYTELYRSPMANVHDRLHEFPDIPLCFAASWYGNRHAWGNFEKFRILSGKNRQPVRLIVGHWLHQEDFMEQRVAGGVNFGNESWIDLNDYRLRWFDRHLKQLDLGPDDEPPLKILVMGGGSGRRDYEDKLEHGGHWRSIAAWPPAEAEPRRLYLTAAGALSADPPPADSPALEYVFDPSDPVPTIGGGVQNPRGVSGLLQGGGFDQRAQPGFALTRGQETLASRPDVLVFRTPPLPRDTEVTGDVMVRLWVRSSAVDTDFTAKLIDEYPPSTQYPQGYALNLVDDIVRMSYRDGRLTRELVEPGAIYQIEIGPMPVSNLFRAGHRIRIDVSSSSFPQFDVNPNTGAPFDQNRGGVPARNSVFVDAARPSVVVLPVVPGAAG
jgi:putative CocE/NonD family hydrolase